MSHHEVVDPDFGTGQKKLSIYVAGIIGCAILTLISFGAVMSNAFSRREMFIILYASACVQFLVQVVCFLRLNMRTQQGRFNVMSFVFFGIILIMIIVGSLWIMSNLNYNLMT